MNWNRFTAPNIGLLVYKRLYIERAVKERIVFSEENMLKFYERDNEKTTPFVALLIPVFSAFRLAKFNIDYRQNENFIGMPTPTSAIFFASLPLVLHQASVSNHTMVKSLIENYWVLSLLVIVFSYLMVSSVVLMSLKFKTLSFTANSTRYIFLFVALVLVLFLKFYAFPIVILFYILLSVLFNPAKRSIISKRQGANHS
jgi:CDP-diacylglycerol--serine O-phosphatidyltransferase